MDDYEVLADSIVVGRIFKAHAVPEDRTPTHEADARGPAMADREVRFRGQTGKTYARSKPYRF
jgi:hypothetical protein